MPSTAELLISTSTCPTHVDDPQPRFVLDLARHLVPHFPRVHLMAPGAEGAAAEEMVDGVRIHRFAYAWPASLQQLCYGMGMMQNLRARRWRWMLLAPFLVTQQAATRQLCKTAPIGVINSHWFLFQSLVGAWSQRSLGVHHVAHSHGADVYLLARLTGGRCFAHHIERGTTRFVCESQYVRTRLDELLGHASNAAISCMGVDAASFVPSADGGTRILFVGRLVEKKGVAWLLRAMRRVRQQVPGAVLQVIGHGEQEGPLRALAAELGLGADVVEFSGARPHVEVVSALARARVVVVPSVMDSHGEVDGMPTVLLEAMASGKRVVGTDVDGIPDVLKDGANGWMCKSADADALADKLVAALTDASDVIPQAARKTAEYYDWPLLAKRYAAFLQNT